LIKLFYIKLESMVKHLKEHAGHNHGEEGHSHSMEMLEPYLMIIAGILIFYLMDIFFDPHGSHDHGNGDCGDKEEKSMVNNPN